MDSFVFNNQCKINLQQYKTILSWIQTVYQIKSKETCLYNWSLINKIILQVDWVAKHLPERLTGLANETMSKWNYRSWRGAWLLSRLKWWLIIQNLIINKGYYCFEARHQINRTKTNKTYIQHSLYVVSASVPWSVLCERGKSENFDKAAEQSS